MESVSGCTVTCDFAIDLRAAGFRVLELFENDDAGAFAHYEPIARQIEGARSRLRAVIPLRERLHVREPSNRHRGDRCFGAAGDHDVGVAVLDSAERITY